MKKSTVAIYAVLGAATVALLSTGTPPLFGSTQIALATDVENTEWKDAEPADPYWDQLQRKIDQSEILLAIIEE